MSLKAVHYINQFYAGIGGETMADTGFGILEEKKGPALGLEQLWNGEMTISKVVYCGDNYVNTDENYGEVKEKLAKVIREEKPDVFIAGPAFNAGRYGTYLFLPGKLKHWRSGPCGQPGQDQASSSFDIVAQQRVQVPQVEVSRQASTLASLSIFAHFFKIIDKALEVLQMDITAPTVFTVDESKED